MTLHSYEVTQGDDELVTAHQAQIPQVITEEEGAGPVRPAQPSGVLTPSTAACLAVITTLHEGPELAPHERADVFVPLRQVRSVLAALWQQGQAQITFEGLRRSCLSALQTGDGETGASPTAQRAVAELLSAVAAVAAARIVYHYVKLGHSWSAAKDRRDRLYDVSSVLETLDWIQGQIMLAAIAGELAANAGVAV